MVRRRIPIKTKNIANNFIVLSCEAAVWVRCAVQDRDRIELKKRTAKTLELTAARGLEIEADNIVAETGSGAALKNRPGILDLLRRIERGIISHLVITMLATLLRKTGTADWERLSTVLEAGRVQEITASIIFNAGTDAEIADWSNLLITTPIN